VRVLALDTCLAACSVAVLDGDRIAAAACEVMERGHQERLAPLVRDTMARAALAFSDLDRIAVTLGPGSFTGLRVGLAFAKGLGLALGRPVVGLGCLEVLHQQFEAGRPLGPPAAGRLAGLEDLDGVTRIVGAVELADGLMPGAQRMPALLPDAAIAARLAVDRTPGDLAPLYMRPPDAKLPGGRSAA